MWFIFVFFAVFIFVLRFEQDYFMKKGRGVGYVAAFYHLHGADDSAVYVYCDGISFFPDSCSGRKDAVAAH